MLITEGKTLEQFTEEKRLWQGIPGVAVTPGGRLYCAFYSGGTKEEIGNYVCLVKSDDGENFSQPVAVCIQEGHRCFDPCVWMDPLDRLWLTWSVTPDDGLYGAICDNPDAEELVFGEEFFIGHNVMMNKPTVLQNGDWAFPIAIWDHESGVRTMSAEWDAPHKPRGSYLYTTSDCGKTFQKTGYADVKRRSFDEHQFLELENGVIRVFVRTKYGIGASDSYDGGKHWGRDFDTGYGGPCSRFYIGRLPSGRILLVNHLDFKGRNNLYAMLSEDEGKTFPYKLLLDERSDVSYPDVAVGQNGEIYVIYDRERGAYKSSMQEVLHCAREILLARITEEEIIQGALREEDSYLKRIVSKLTDYNGKEHNPFCEDDRFSNQDYATFLCKECDDSGAIDRIMSTYPLNCCNIHNLEAKELDALVKEYSQKRDLETLVQIITIVRNASTVQSCSENSIVNEICQYLIDHLSGTEEEGDIAEYFNYSINYLRHLFKQHTGTTMVEFRNAQRIMQAKLLLCDNKYKIADIASRCGFDHPSYFAEVFKREVGVSPTEYRRQHATEN